MRGDSDFQQLIFQPFLKANVASTLADDNPAIPL